MGNDYTHDDVMQALIAALNYGQWGIGREAQETDGGDLHTRGGLTVRVSQGARDLLAEAQGIIDEHGGMALGMHDGRPLAERDIWRAVMEHDGEGE